MNASSHSALGTALALIAMGCSTVEPDEGDVIFPGAFDLPLVGLEALRHTRPAPDSVNVLAYIVDERRCPPDAMCIVPDAILIASDLTDPEESMLWIPTVIPRYEQGVRYVISIAYSERTLTGSQLRRDFRLLGLSVFSQGLDEQGRAH